MTFHRSLGDAHPARHFVDTQILPIGQEHRGTLTNTQPVQRRPDHRIARQLPGGHTRRPRHLTPVASKPTTNMHPRRVRRRPKQVGPRFAYGRPGVVPTTQQTHEHVRHQIGRITRTDQRRRIPNQIVRKLHVRLLQRANALHTPTMPHRPRLGDTGETSVDAESRGSEAALSRARRGRGRRWGCRTRRPRSARRRRLALRSRGRPGWVPARTDSARCRHRP